ncbi:MAG: hypothetical protein EB127_31740 [Alphaproteobacteria bacterium]|nr:hypothetical protein [Alphaproteobacteria bacterium]
MRLEKIENNTKVYDFDWFYDFIDCGEFYLLTELRNMTNSTVMITLNQNTTLEDIQEKYGGYLEYHKLCFVCMWQKKGNSIQTISTKL